MPKFEEYESYVITEIAKEIESPYWFQQLLNVTGKPIDKLIEGAKKIEKLPIRKVTDAVSSAVEEGLITTIKTANKLHNEESILKRFNKVDGISIKEIRDIQNISLKHIDLIANSHKLANRMLLVGEGALMGGLSTVSYVMPLFIPGIVVADISASMTLLSRHTCQISTSYGFQSNNPVNIPLILEAMLPPSGSEDEGFIQNKVALQNEFRVGFEFIKRNQDEVIDLIGKNQAPKVLQILQSLAQRLGITLTEKQLAVLIPVIGAVSNASMNYAFHESSHRNVQNYFRKLLLEDRYGKKEIQEEINKQREIIKNKKKNKKIA
ncbi:EcsC family protein [Schinkia sp. CFF1]